MITLSIGIVLILLGLLALALQRFYSSIPAKELKRLAARGDQLAEALYRPVAYGSSMRLLLWAVFCVSLTGGFVLASSQLVSWALFGLILITVVLVVLLQSVRLTVRRAHFAVRLAPALNWALGYMHRPFDAAIDLSSRFHAHTAHSGLFEKEDVLDLLAQQSEQPDNRIDSHDLNILINAVQFDERRAADIVLPMSRTKPVSVNDHIGPVLLGELHDSGQNSFLVYEETSDHVVGTLLLRDAVQAREGGRVGDLMHPRVCYVHEDFTLRQVLQAFTHTGHFLVVVINSFEEPVGVITLGHLLAQLVGESGENDFDAFEDRSAVAAYKPAVSAAPVTEQAREEQASRQSDVEPEGEIPDADSQPEATSPHAN
ncbi:MAG TPA: CBS domain-containing protein [Bacillota bacterium]|nr:CBS domain-containing protein [Bacillota bacterium]